MKERKIVADFIIDVAKIPLNLGFIIADIFGIIAVFVWVIDDWKEALVFIAVLFVWVFGGYLIYRQKWTKITELEQQLQEMENKRPKLDLSIADSEQCTESFTLYVGRLVQEPDYEQIIAEESAALESQFNRPKPPKPADTSIASMIKAAVETDALNRTRKSKAEYKEECDAYLGKYRSYLKRKYLYDTLIARFRQVTIEISNEEVSRMPGQDIIALADFPEQLEIPDIEDLMYYEWILEGGIPTPPTRPKTTTSITDIMQETIWGIGDPSSHITDQPVDTYSSASAVNEPTISFEESNRVRYEIPKLIHGFSIELQSIGFLVSEDAIGKTLDIPYSIHGSNLPEKISGNLTVEIKQKPG